MGSKLGLVGLPNAGKSTLFNALTHAHAAVAPYPFTTTDRNVGIASVEDPRLEALGNCVSPERVVPTSIEFVDIAGLVKGAHKGEGLGNQFLSHVYSVDALLHVVRCFEDSNVAHTLESVDPLRDVEIITTELLLKDLEILQRRADRDQKLARSGDKQAQKFLDVISRWIEALSKGIPIRRLPLAGEEHPKAFGIDLLSAKPVLYIANIEETALSAAWDSLRQKIADEQSGLVICCAKLEAELVELEPSDRQAMMQACGIQESALNRIIRESATLLRLISFFTTTSKILQAWTIPKGTKAPQAAGVIHTDFEKQFIRAEVISTKDLVRCASESAARAQGLLRLEGKDYVVQDGDVIHFRIGQ